jgi:tRNA dimethylallyltransferase
MNMYFLDMNGDFLDMNGDFLEALKSISKRGNLSILCGGTGLYLDAVLRNYKMDKVPENRVLREELKSKPD